MRDVGLRLAFEKPLVTALAQTRGGVHDELGVGGERNTAIPGQIVAMRRLRVGASRDDLQMNQIVFTVVVTSHRSQRFPINAFFINAQPAPRRLILKNLMRQLVDAGTRLARCGTIRQALSPRRLLAADVYHATRQRPWWNPRRSRVVLFLVRTLF